MGADAKAKGAGPCRGRLHGGARMVAAKKPARGPGLKAGVVDDIGSGRADDLDVVHEALAIVEQAEVEPVDRAIAVVHAAGPRHLRPWRLLRLVRVRPVRGQPRVRVRVLQLEAGAAAVRPLAPCAAVRVPDLAHDDVNGVRCHHALAVRGPNLVGHRQTDDVAAVAEGALIASDHARGRHVRMVGTKPGRVLGQHHELARPEPGSRREIKRDAAPHPPTRQVQRANTPVEELHELVGIPPGRVVEDLVDHHLLHAPGRVGHPRRGLREAAP